MENGDRQKFQPQLVIGNKGMIREEESIFFKSMAPGEWLMFYWTVTHPRVYWQYQMCSLGEKKWWGNAMLSWYGKEWT